MIRGLPNNELELTSAHLQGVDQRLWCRAVLGRVKGLRFAPPATRRLRRP